MQARYPKHVVVLVEGLVLPIDTDEAVVWMRERVQKCASAALISKALVYQKERSSGTMAKPRFLSVFETENVDGAFGALGLPYGMSHCARWGSEALSFSQACRESVNRNPTVV